MERRRLQIPSGMQDTLPGECAGKRRLEDKLRRLFTLGGYQEIETPILEYYDALDDQTFGYRPEQVWKTFDPQARILAVRPDSTIPAVRLASGRLKNAPLPLRLCYVQSAAKFHSETLSLLCEDTQAGVELMGEGSAQADAEVIALAVEALRAAGIRDFLIELGQVKFVSGFLEEAGLQQVARLGRDAGSVEGRVFQQPDELARGPFGDRRGAGLHRRHGGGIVDVAFGYRPAGGSAVVPAEEGWTPRV